MCRVTSKSFGKISVKSVWRVLWCFTLCVLVYCILSSPPHWTIWWHALLYSATLEIESTYYWLQQFLLEKLSLVLFFLINYYITVYFYVCSFYLKKLSHSCFMNNLNTHMVDYIHLFLFILIQYPEEGAHKLFTY